MKPLTVGDAMMLVVAELNAAERKHPGYPTDPIHAAGIVGEEAGELCAAALQYTYEGGTVAAMRQEAVHTGAMALRFLMNMHEMGANASMAREVVGHPSPDEAES